MIVCMYVDMIAGGDAFQLALHSHDVVRLCMSQAVSSHLMAEFGRRAPCIFPAGSLVRDANSLIVGLQFDLEVKTVFATS